MRNNLLTKDLLIDKYKKHENKMYASWDHIIAAYEIDKYSLFRQRQMPKLNNKHIFQNLKYNPKNESKICNASF